MKIKEIIDEISNEMLTTPSPIPSHLPIIKLIIIKIILNIMKTDGIPYCKEFFFLLNIKEIPMIITLKRAVINQKAILSYPFKKVLES